MMIFRYAVLAVVSLFTVSSAIAAELKPGVQYSGKVKLESPEYGASFELPAGWKGVLPPDGEFFVMQSGSFEGYVFAGIDEMTVGQAEETMNKSIDLGDGIVLNPKGKARLDGSKLTATYTVTGSQNPLVGHITTIVGKHGLGVSFIAATQPQNEAALKKTIKHMTASLSLVKPKAPSGPSAGKSSGPWAQQLSGRKLTYFFTRTGYTEEDYIWLCPGGRFYKSANSGGFGGGASGAFQSSNGGKWSASGGVNQGSLVLAYNDGSTATYAVTQDSTKLFLDGKRYFREATNCN